MSRVHSYVFSIVCAAVICAVIKIFAKKNTGTNALVKFAAALFLTVTVATPVVNLGIGELPIRWDAIYAQAQMATEEGKDSAKKELEEIIKTKTQAYVLDKADSLGLDLEVEITVDNSELPVPASVVLTGAAAPYAKARLSNIIANDLAVPKEAQIWN